MGMIAVEGSLVHGPYSTIPRALPASPTAGLVPLSPPPAGRQKPPRTGLTTALLGPLWGLLSPRKPDMLSIA